MVFAACSQVMAISSRPVKTDSDERLYDILDDCSEQNDDEEFRISRLSCQRKGRDTFVKHFTRDFTQAALISMAISSRLPPSHFHLYRQHLPA